VWLGADATPSPVRPILRCPIVHPALRLRRSTVAFLLVGALFGCREDAPEPDPKVGAEHVTTGPLAGRTGAFLTVSDAASRVQLAVGTLPGLLYRISTPAGSGLAPRVSRDHGRVRASLRPTGAEGPDEVRIVLNRDVRWDIRLPAGGGEQQLDLRGGRITRVELGASGLIEMRLPEPAGTLPVTFGGGAGTVSLTAPEAAPVRIRLDRGADSASTPWTSGGAVDDGAVLQSAKWPTARDRFLIRARSGVGMLTLRPLRPEAR
jgi:hypothetical protein